MKSLNVFLYEVRWEIRVMSEDRIWFDFLFWVTVSISYTTIFLNVMTACTLICNEKVHHTLGRSGISNLIVVQQQSVRTAID